MNPNKDITNNNVIAFPGNTTLENPGQTKYFSISSDTWTSILKTPEGEDMDRDKDLLGLLIERLSTDQSDLKRDLIESEKRISERTAAIEARMDHRLNRIEDSISNTAQANSDKIDKLIEKIENKQSNQDDKILGLMYAVWGLVIAVVLSVGAMVLSVVLA